MSLADDMGPDDGGDSIVAAEYVLGVLPFDERRVVAERIDAEQAFARLVDRWQAYFAPLATAYAAVDVPTSVKAAIDRRLFSDGQTSSGATVVPARGLWGSLAFWRALTAAALAALAIYVAIPYIAPPSEEFPHTLVASLSPNGSGVSYLAVYDEQTGDVGLSHISGEPLEGRDFELWVIEGQGAPVSLGVIPDGESARFQVSDEARDNIVDGALFAISDEPSGGSPTGQPTGPVVAAGDLRAI